MLHALKRSPLRPCASLRARLAAQCARFVTNDKGAVAIIATLVMPVLLMFSATVIDYSSALKLRSASAASLDAALLAAAREFSTGGLEENDIQAFVNEYFDASMIGQDIGAVSIGEVTTAYDDEAGLIAGSVEATSKAIFSQLINPQGVDVAVEAEVTVSLLNIELALVLDVTGSMRGSKLEALQDASHALINMLVPEGSDGNGAASVRVSLVPYSDLVNVGDYETAITGYDSNESCVYERNDGYEFTDTAPYGPVAGTDEDDDGYVNYAPWGSGNRYEKTIINDPSNFRGYRCFNPELMPLTANGTALSDRIDSFSASGWTAGHIGIQWGWYTLSPHFQTVWPAESTPVAYDEEETLKVMVIMTDGAFNTWYEDGIGSSFSQGYDLCDEIKETDIQIYSVGFMTRSSAERFLRQCASDSENYFDASSPNDLLDAFQQIGEKLTDIRLAS